MNTFTLYNSSAGSGKTYTLTKEYLKIVLLEPWKYEHILAITFTKKAANEMKERIISALINLSKEPFDETDQKTNSLLIAIMQETGTPKTLLLSNAKKALNNILHQYSNFAVSTIDSFVNKIIRTFAFDLRLPGNFEIELETSELLNEVTDLLISEVGTEEWLTSTLINFSLYKLDEKENWKIEKSIQNIAKELWQENAKKETDSLKELDKNEISKAIVQIRNYINNYKKQITTIAKEGNELIKNSGLNEKSFYQGKNGIFNYFSKIINNPSDTTPNSYVITTITEDKWYTSKISANEKNIIDNIKNQVTECFQKIQNQTQSEGEKFKLLSMLYNNIYPLSLLTEIKNKLEEIKSERNIIPISEFNAIISEIVINEPVPFIYERVGEKYHHFLIDEFQDTSTLQWTNFLPLIENSLASGNFNMLVGDAKQSIYRWRNGEVEQFISLPKIFKAPSPIIKQKERILEENFEVKVLDTNYRSKEQIIRFNNELFSTLKNLLSEHYQQIYEPQNVIQKFKPENTGGYVEINFFENNIDYDTETIKQIQQIIEEQLADNYQLSDISIICRSNKDANYIASELSNLHYPVISSESLLIDFSPKVRFIIALMQYINNPDDIIARTIIIKYLFDEKLIKKNYSGLHELLSSSKEIETQIHELLNHNINSLQKLSLFDLAEEIIRIFKMNTKADAYIQFFLDTVFKYMHKFNPSLNEFIDWYYENKSKLSLSIPEGENAINILSIHKSKGLEFKIVICPYLKSKIMNTKDSFWGEIKDETTGKIEYGYFSLTENSTKDTRFYPLLIEENNKTTLDNINLLYVAFTRAVDRLYILSGKENEVAKTSNTGNYLIYYLQQKNIFEPNKRKYIWGEKTQNTNPLETNKSIQTPPIFISNNWHDKIAISYSAEKLWGNEKINKGTLIHNLLAEIQSEKCINSTLNKALIEGIIEEKDLQEIKNIIQKIIHHPLLNEYYQLETISKNECDIIIPGNIVKRPDKLIFKNNKVTILDFKTGNPEKKHIEQIQTYGKIINNMGYELNKLLLVYLDKHITITEINNQNSKQEEIQYSIF